MPESQTKRTPGRGYYVELVDGSYVGPYATLGAAEDAAEHLGMTDDRGEITATVRYVK